MASNRPNLLILAADGKMCCNQDFAKINQDRACVVHPFMGSDACALLCVYDGHGERGDMVRRVATP